MSVGKDERSAQAAVGLEKEFKITIEVPLQAVGIINQEIKAISEEDACAQILTMLKMKTKSQILLDLEVNGVRNTRIVDGVSPEDYDINITNIQELPMSNVANIFSKMPNRVGKAGKAGSIR